MNGILIINKPTGYTSRDIVNIVGKKLNIKKVGHTGTLDPLASGVLVLCVGRYTKLVESLTSLDKEYIGEIKLGIRTDTLDITGNILEEKVYNVTKEEIESTFKKFIGKYDMEVPLYSAIKVSGKKLYEYARNNIEVKLPIKTVEVKELELLEYSNDLIKFRAKVEKGTYIRSLIRDICLELNIVGTMNSLIRTRQGTFDILDTITLKEIEENNFKLLSISEVLNIDTYILNEEEYKLVKNGNKIKLDRQDDLVLLTYQEKETAIYMKDNDLYKAKVMIDIM